MKRVGVVALLFLLSACDTAQDAPPVATVAKVSCPTDAAEAWQQYLSAIPDVGTEAARPYLNCAVASGHVQAMTALGTELTGKGSATWDFEQGIVHLRNAAVAGEERAQRLLAYRYQAGRDWVGRNAYLAMFWYGVANRDDPFYRSAPKIRGQLEAFRDHLSSRSKDALAKQIAAWQPGTPEPPNYTFDILMTAALRGLPSDAMNAENIIAEAALDYGLKTGLPDAGLLAVMRGYGGNADQVPSEVVDRLVARGSFLALTLKLRNGAGQEGREAEELVLIFQLLSRLGLDPRYLQPNHDQLLSRFSKTGDVDQLMNAIAAGSRPERQILATIAAMNACSAASAGLCDRTLARVEPLISPVALSFLNFIRAMETCTVPQEKLSCLLDNGGMTALRDIIVNDTVDHSGRAT